jgi:hypothetical protein
LSLIDLRTSLAVFMNTSLGCGFQNSATSDSASETPDFETRDFERPGLHKRNQAAEAAFFSY